MLKTIINKFFKKTEDKIPEDLGAKFYWPMEADPRDFKTENVLWKPTNEEIKNIPKSIDLLKKCWDKLTPIYQWCVPSCTISSLSNYITLLEVINTWYEVDWEKWAKLCREKMKHKWSCQWEHWDYLENALKCVKTNWLLSEITNYNPLSITDKYLKIDWYAYSNSTRTSMKYYLSKWYPLYFAFRWNKNTWLEISKWEIKTSNFTATWWHAVMSYWYDDNYLYFLNSWKPNDWDKYKWDYSVFKIKWEVLEDMLKRWLANWRFWIAYFIPYKEKMTFKDYKIDENTEVWKAVKELTDKWIIKWVPHNDWTYLEPARPITRLEVIVIIYRVIKMFIKQP